MNEASLIELLSNESEKYSEDSSTIFSVIDTEISGWKENTSSTFVIAKKIAEPVRIRVRKIESRHILARNSSSIIY